MCNVIFSTYIAKVHSTARKTIQNCQTSLAFQPYVLHRKAQF
jgi:hypothetical protein